jgi:predicted Rossmann fold nucleotide-binding protein DprA/Smf involved in DNA uptake
VFVVKKREIVMTKRRNINSEVKASTAEGLEKRVLAFLDEEEHAKTNTIVESLQVSKQELFPVLVRLETSRKIFCRAGFWRVKS